ncbi:FecR domain-containing protein [Paracoccus benzoatiresistens]|uniref:TonB-dependent receptor n=1 Tax=Paracoccus benzoatiresistens TaxID=2997341 RepID=A0ABT4J6C1_9RHOB|nr:FecR domain-containing protein [Paracoccus sp. EF6]MCZ0962627.1 TonB-dependent receptor [Paracoccus sp. EF6]
MRLRFLWQAVVLCLLAGPVLAEPVPRSAAPAGSVIARKSGEEVQFIDLAGWNAVELAQDLLAGDVLRTNATGNLAVLFADRTQMRLARNTTMVVKKIGPAADSVFELQRGTLWGRAMRGGLGLTVETPAAAAAIRGTDFALTVEGDRTALTVLEGIVTLANAQGAVTVRQGEGAAARIGEAPTKIVVTDPSDREQMLTYLSLRSAFSALAPTPLPHARLRAERARLAAVAPAAQGLADLVTAAEVAFALEGSDAARAAVARARTQALTPGLAARLDLVEGLIAANERRYGDAQRLFRQAAPHLDADRRAVAENAGYFSRALADPDHVEAPPAASDTPAGALARAYAQAVLLDIPAALADLAAAEARFPDQAGLPAARAQLAMLMDDRAQAQAAIARALAIDPDDPNALEARAVYRTHFEGRYAEALADLQRATAAAPGVSSLWNQIGLVQATRGANREAEAAFRRAIALQPMDPVAYANLAFLYLDQDRPDRAKPLIDRALALDPAFDVALFARGRWHLQRGDIAAAQEDLLAGSTANPAYSQGLLLLAAAHIAAGEREPAEQALENAERLDPNDPVTAQAVASFAIDEYEADRAIAAAQSAMRRARERGGDFAGAEANRTEGSLLNQAFRLQGLDAWGRSYGDAVFNPFDGASLVDQAVAGSAFPVAANLRYGSDFIDPTPDPGGFSALFQGLLLSPEILTGRSRGNDVLRRPFVEATLGGGTVETEDGGRGSRSIELQGFGNSPVPVSGYLLWEDGGLVDTRRWREPGSAIPLSQFDLDERASSGLAYATASITPDDHLVVYAQSARERSEIGQGVILLDQPLLPFDAIAYQRSRDTRLDRAGLGFSHSFAWHNVVEVAVFGTEASQQTDETGVIVSLRDGDVLGLRNLAADVAQDTRMAALGWRYGRGPWVLRTGIETGRVTASRAQESITFLGPVPDVAREAWQLDFDVARAWADLIWDIDPALRVEAGALATRFTGDLDLSRVDPRIGLSWRPVDRHWLRAAWIADTAGTGDTTLSPIGVVALQASRMALDPGGRAETAILRWDAEWSDRLFTVVDVQRQRFTDISIPDPTGLDWIDLAEGRLDRVAATVNWKLPQGFGVFATLARSDSENRDPASPGYGDGLPFVPDSAARLGVTWVHPANIRASLLASWIGPRTGDEAGQRLDGIWTLDLAAIWESPDQRFVAELNAWNLLDERFEVAPQIEGWGRTVEASLKIRF